LSGPVPEPATARTVTTGSPQETAELAGELAGELAPGDVVLLTGEVGAGKSTLARAAMEALGVEGPIPSPTFTIGRLYEGRGGLPVAHLDLYRIESIEDEDPGLLSEYLDPRGIVFAEWPGAGAGELIRRARRIRRIEIAHLDRDSRSISISPFESG
jgi:tRNA threonylcarbamoyladenosine biosynthesis protein TsaE